MKYAHVLAYISGRPLAIRPEKLAQIQAFLAFKAAGGQVEPSAIAELAATQRSGSPSESGAVAVVPLYGILTQRGGMDMKTSESFTSVEQFARTLRAVAADPSVAAVIVEVDSPGGEVFGVAEAADVVHELATGDKPIAAIANSLACSAAYWIASQANELVVSPSGQVGSIGVYGIHEDLSRMIEALGVTPSVISAGKFKTELSPFGPLSDDARAAFQAEVDGYYDQFVSAVARGRGVPPAAVRGGMGQGRTVGAAEAVGLGMADRVQTLDALIERLSNPRRRASVGRRSAAEAYLPAIITSGHTVDLTAELLDEADSTPAPEVVAGQDSATLVDLDTRRRRLRLVPS